MSTIQTSFIKGYWIGIYADQEGFSVITENLSGVVEKEEDASSLNEARDLFHREVERLTVNGGSQLLLDSDFNFDDDVVVKF